jgi:DNA-binding transcriptional ArsR family regulator
MPRGAAVESVFQTIACPTRRALLDSLSQGEKNVSELMQSVAVTQSAVSQQLAILKNAGLVRERSQGRFRYYRLRAQPLTEVTTWVARYRGHVERELDALGRVLDALPDEPEADSVAKDRR